jgi:hypothetical protein
MTRAFGPASDAGVTGALVTTSGREKSGMGIPGASVSLKVRAMNVISPPGHRKAILSAAGSELVIDRSVRDGNISPDEDSPQSCRAVTLGQFTPEEIRAGFREGKFVGTDLAWRDGMASWQPLSEVIDEIAPETEESGVPPLLAAAGGLPWERRAEVGFFSALFETIRLVLLEPKAAFATMKQTGGLGAPLFFFVLLSTVGLFTKRFSTRSNPAHRPRSGVWRRR